MTPHSLQKTHRSHRLRGRLSVLAASLAVAAFPSVGLAADPAEKGVAPRPSGHEIGNGGGAWVCRELNGNIRMAGLVDLYEAEAEHGLKLASFKGSRDEILETIYHRIQSISPAWYAELEPYLERVGNLGERSGDEVDADHPPIRPTQDRLVRTSDLEVFRMAPDANRFCPLGQMASPPEIVVNYTNEPVIHVYQPLKEALSEKGVAALAIHEAIYAWRRSPNLKDPDSINSRRIVGLLFSDLRPRGSKQKGDKRPTVSWLRDEFNRLGLVPKYLLNGTRSASVTQNTSLDRASRTYKTRGGDGKIHIFQEVIWPSESPLSKIRGTFWKDERGVIWGPRVKGSIAIPNGGRFPNKADVLYLTHYFGRSFNTEAPILTWENANTLSERDLIRRRGSYKQYTALLPDLFMSGDKNAGIMLEEGAPYVEHLSKRLGALQFRDISSVENWVYHLYLPSAGILVIGCNGHYDDDAMLFGGIMNCEFSIDRFDPGLHREVPDWRINATVRPYYVFDAK